MAACGDGQVRVWSLRDERGPLTFNDDQERTWSVTAPQAQYLAASTGDGHVRLWDLVSGEMLWERDADAGRVRSVVDPPGTRLAVGSGTGDIYVRDVVVGRFTAHLPDHRGRVLMLGFPANPDRLISAAADGTARIWSLSEQRQIAEVRIDASLHCAAYDPTTGRLLAASAAGLAMVTVDLPCPGQ